MSFYASNSSAILVKNEGLQVVVDALMAAGVEFEVIDESNQWKLEEYTYYLGSYNSSSC